MINLNVLFVYYLTFQLFRTSLINKEGIHQKGSKDGAALPYQAAAAPSKKNLAVKRAGIPGPVIFPM